MPYLFKQFDIIVETTYAFIRDWLIAEAHDISDEPIRARVYPDDKLVTVYNPNILSPTVGLPSYQFTLCGRAVEQKKHINSEISGQGITWDEFIKINIRLLSPSKIQLIGYWVPIEAVAPLNYLKERIIQVFSPQIVFDFEKTRIGFNRPDINSFEELIFDFIIESTPTLFVDWTHNELGRLYPGVLTIINTPQSSEFLYCSGEFIPPDEQYPHYFYVIYGNLSIFSDETQTTTHLGPITAIELIKLNDGKLQAICACNNFPPLIDFLIEFRTQVIRVFNPRYSSNVDESILQRLDSMSSNLGNKLDDIKQGQLAIYQRIDEDSKKSLSLVLQGIRDKQLEKDVMITFLEEIRQALKHIQQNGIPIQDNELKKMLTDIEAAVNSNLNLQQKLELSIPIIPFLLQYKFEINIGVDLETAWNDIVERFLHRK